MIVLCQILIKKILFADNVNSPSSAPAWNLGLFIDKIFLIQYFEMSLSLGVIMDWSGKKILYCCPAKEHFMLQSGLSILKAWGAQPLMAEAPEDALKILQDSGDEIAAIVVHPEDFLVQWPEFFVQNPTWLGAWNQPRKMGYRFCRMIRNLYPELPIIVRYILRDETIRDMSLAHLDHEQDRFVLIDEAEGMRGVKRALDNL